MLRFYPLLLTLFTLFSGTLPAEAQRLSFKKGFRLYQRGAGTGALHIFKYHYAGGGKHALAAAYFIHKIADFGVLPLPDLLAANTDLYRIDSLYARLPPKKVRRLTRKYGVTAGAITEVRQEAQHWVVGNVRRSGTLTALDTLLQTRTDTALQSMVDEVHFEVVQAHLDDTDYDVMTKTVRRHLGWVRPANYAKSRRLYSRLWPAFQQKYSLCQLDQFVREHPGSVIGTDCWKEDLRSVFCRGDLGEMLDCHRDRPHTALELNLVGQILEKGQRCEPAALRPDQWQRLQDLRQRATLRDYLNTGRWPTDTALFRGQLGHYIQQYAPRYSAFRLLEDALQFYLEKKEYRSATGLLCAVRPFFPDTLPKNCRTNLNFQKRVQPYIDSKLPILSRPPQTSETGPLRALNTEEGDEHSPVCSADGRELYFAASGRRDNASQQDIFVARPDTAGQWANPQLVPVLSGPGDQVPLSLTADGRQMLLQLDRRLCLSDRAEDGTWLSPRPVVLSGVAAVGRASLSADGLTLVLEAAFSRGSASQEPDIDLFISTRTDRNSPWSAPRAFDAGVNTEDTEGAPLLTPDGRLYFTSTGYPGMGQADVFVSRREGTSLTTWRRAYNLGREVNDTFPQRGWSSLSSDGRVAFYALYPRGVETGDLWMITVPTVGDKFLQRQ